MHGHGVAAEAEEDALAEDEQPAAAPGEAHADRHDRVTQVFGEEVEPEVGQGERGDAEEQGGAEEEGAWDAEAVQEGR